MELGLIKQEERKWEQIKKASKLHSMRNYIPKLNDIDENPFCVERRIADIQEITNLNKVSGVYYNWH